MRSAAVRSALYRGTVSHTRLRPFRHSFKYRVFYGLFDLDELDRLDHKTKWFARNRFNLFSFHDTDHVGGDAPTARTWIDRVLTDAGWDLQGGRVELLAFPRVLGYVFNPISIWYCYDAAGELRVVLHEVRNTFGDRHAYLVPIDGDLRHSFDKVLHVSPFMDLDSRYAFSMTPPGRRVAVGIRQHDAGGELFRAGLRATRLPFDDRTLLRLFVTHPLLTLKAISAIHWQALKLWRKGATFHRRPSPPAKGVTVVASRHVSAATIGSPGT